MKKFLSLVLALVMTMSLVTISAGAKDFTDDDKVNYEEAVAVISELGIVDGYSAGDFRPSNTLTRGAAAKIICNMILGPTTADALSATSAPFSDVPADSVFAGYITYCAKEGIISGYADGTFRPAGTLNGYQFMKMLLGALGYDSDIEGFTGPNWSINVAKLAIGIGLDDDLTEAFNGSKAVTREEACLYALNTLQAVLVKYGQKTTVSVNGAEVVVSNSDANKIEQVGGADKDKLGDEKYQQFGEEYFPDLKKSDAYDDFERPANTWKLKNDKIGTYAKTPAAVYTAEVKGKDVYADLGDKYSFEQIDIKDENNKEDTAPAYFVDGERTDLPTKSGSTFAVEKNNDDAKVGGNGVRTEVYIIEGATEDYVRIVSAKTYLAQVSGDYDEDKEELELVNVEEDGVSEVPAKSDDEMILSADKFSNLDTFEDEDYVLVTVASGVIKSIAKAEVVTGTVSNFETDEFVTVDGTKYKYNKTYADGEGVEGDYTIDDDSYELYVDEYGYVMLVKGVEDDTKYVYIDEAYAATNAAKSLVKANAYFLDGTNEEITVNKVGTTSVKGENGAKLAERGWYSYTIKSDKYNLTKAAPAVEAKGDITDKDTVTITNNGKVLAKGTSSTVFVVVDDDDDVTVYTGIKKVPEITVKDATTGDKGYISVVFEKNTVYAKYVFVDLGDHGEATGGETSGDIIFVYKSAFDKRGGEIENDNVYYSYKAVLNGEATKVKFDGDHDDLKAEASDVGLYVKVEYDENGYVSKYTSVTEANYDAADPKTEDYSAQEGITGTGTIAQKNGVVTIDGVDYYMADGAKIMVIDDGAVKTVTAKKLAADYEARDVYGVMNSNGEYTYLFVNTNKA